MLTKRSFLLTFLSLISFFPFIGESKSFNVSTKEAISLVQQDNDIYAYVEQKPEFPGGSAALNKFLTKNLKYPEKARLKNQQGIVKVYFVVRKDGSIDRISVIKSAGKLLDAEAIRLVKAMPKWRPGYNHGKAVNVQQSLPIAFHFSYSSYYED
ncbi:energy transducer TonB [Solitalea koreensis]|uniref:TonB family C-terminal domain-containing protein n=1 Tax=Solitalea koreensis TaxID=543615 RepID=A0A521C5J8_9SPHI|nr:energy transducer TonB [Solitalea koreensis]SMO54726.1 TonB family C-terminal domain-containing protein [Solitalea koreensis]